MANLVCLQGSFPLAESQRWKWEGLKAVYCLLTATRIKSAFGRGVDGLWVTPNCSEALVFVSPVFTSVTEKRIRDFKFYLLTSCKRFWSLSSPRGLLEIFVSSSETRIAKGYLIDGVRSCWS